MPYASRELGRDARSDASACSSRVAARRARRRDEPAHPRRGRCAARPRAARCRWPAVGAGDALRAALAGVRGRARRGRTRSHAADGSRMPARRWWSRPAPASGKSLAYQLPALTALLGRRPGAGALLSPDQGAGRRPAARAARRSTLPVLRAATYDGDTPTEERDWVRAHANWVLTNPDMLHRGDAARRTPAGRRSCAGCATSSSTSATPTAGVFGSHVAQVLRRLRRVCARYGADADVRAGLGDRGRPGGGRPRG